MKASILIVSRNRREELRKTLTILEQCIKPAQHEIRVFLDGCEDGSEALKKLFPRVCWTGSEKKLGASKARNILYKQAEGDLIFGFDDDAHPLQKDFIALTEELFYEQPTVGIVGFGEVKGKFENDEQIPKAFVPKGKDFYTNDFKGCGFAVKKQVYEQTRGFPVWIDIYGEEMCVAIEVLELGYGILSTNRVLINHRVDKEKRKVLGADLLRFEKQLKNTTYFYMVYYPFPLVMKKVLMLYRHNLLKYALKDQRFFRGYVSAFFMVVRNFKTPLKFRKPLKPSVINKLKMLPNPSY